MPWKNWVPKSQHFQTLEAIKHPEFLKNLVPKIWPKFRLSSGFLSGSSGSSGRASAKSRRARSLFLRGFGAESVDGPSGIRTLDQEIKSLGNPQKHTKARHFSLFAALLHSKSS
jgi:hypothetical protein